MALYPFFRPLAFALDAERAHRWTIGALKRLPAGRPAGTDSALAGGNRPRHDPTVPFLGKRRICGTDTRGEAARQAAGGGGAARPLLIH